MIGMAKANAAINPLLISVLTGEDMESIPPLPTVEMLPGQYVKLIAGKIKKIERTFKPNRHLLICGYCRNLGFYDLGLIAFHFLRHEQDEKKFRQAGEPFEPAFLDYIQSTGYFRCHHCNGAGAWETEDASFSSRELIWMLQSIEKSKMKAHEIRLYDGSMPRWASDAEESFLCKLRESGEDGYLWNRLGNLFLRGGRPELAASAFERSLQVDRSQMESYYSLGDLLLQIGDMEKAAPLLRLALIYGGSYGKLETVRFREMLATVLQMLRDIHLRSRRKIAFLPTSDEWALVHSVCESAASAELNLLSLADLDISIKDRTSFYPLAEIFMGLRRNELPAHERTLDKHMTGGGGPRNMTIMNPNINERLPNQLGSHNRPLIMRVQSTQRFEQVTQICEKYRLKFIMGIEIHEDLTDLRKAILEVMTPKDVYSPCTCGSGQKFKFCCAGKWNNFDIKRFIADETNPTA
jgi:tetratricopeptide (TPR) repeat protein